MNEFLEPTLYALRHPTGDRLRPVIDQVREAELRARIAARREGHLLDPPSFELGVAHALISLLTTAKQRSALNDAIRAVKESGNLATLHQIAVVNRAAEDSSQKRLAELLGADPGNFNRRIGKLVELGLVEARREGKSLYHSLTPLGLDVLAQMRPGWRALHPITGELVTTEGEAGAIASQMISQLLGQEAKNLPDSRLVEADVMKVVIQGMGRHVGPFQVRRGASPGKPSIRSIRSPRPSVKYMVDDHEYA